MSVGYDLYLKLLEEAVLEERGEEKQIETECAADLTVNAHIPDRYVPSPEQRMDLYRRIAAIRTRRGRLGPAGRDAGPLRRGAQVRAGPAGRGAAACCRGQGRRVRHLPEGQRPAAAPWACSTHEALVAVCGHAKYRQRLTLAAGEIPALHPEAQARGGCAGGRPGPGGGPEAGRGGGRGRDPVSFIMFLPCPA